MKLAVMCPETCTYVVSHDTKAGHQVTDETQHNLLRRFVIHEHRRLISTMTRTDAQGILTYRIYIKTGQVTTVFHSLCLRYLLPLLLYSDPVATM